MRPIPNKKRACSLAIVFSLLLGFLAVMPLWKAQAQTRVNDHDMEAMMRNLRDDVKNFRPHFDDAIRKSTIRKTSEARNARDSAATLQKQTHALLERFKKDRNGQSEFSAVMTTAQSLDQRINSLSLDARTTAEWNKIRTEVSEIANAYGMPQPFDQDNGSMMPMGSNNSDSCLQSAGAVKANQLVNECLEVSPATHPPCNAQNSCALIISEIRRSCALDGANAPAFCSHYR
jgi:hypothetical protein